MVVHRPRYLPEDRNALAFPGTSADPRGPHTHAYGRAGYRINSSQSAPLYVPPLARPRSLRRNYLHLTRFRSSLSTFSEKTL